MVGLEKFYNQKVKFIRLTILLKSNKMPVNHLIRIDPTESLYINLPHSLTSCCINFLKSTTKSLLPNVSVDTRSVGF